jgi:hypothetical protein
MMAPVKTKKPPATKAAKRTKKTMNLSPDAIWALGRIVERSGCSQGEATSVALQMLDSLQVQAEQGFEQVWVKSRDGEAKQVVFIPPLLPRKP